MICCGSAYYLIVLFSKVAWFGWGWRGSGSVDDSRSMEGDTKTSKPSIRVRIFLIGKREIINEEREKSEAHRGIQEKLQGHHIALEYR